MPDTAPAIELSRVRLTRNGREVLRGVDAAFARGEVTAVVGPSGSGKTSLLRCINRLEEPMEGSVHLDGLDVRTLAAQDLRRRVGMIFQTPILFEGGVRANLEYGLRPVAEDVLVDALERAGLDRSFLGRSIALSVGQAQRVCIARALLRQPEALLMDEPTSALDRNARSRIERLIKDLSSTGLTIVLVTHDLGQAKRLATRAHLLIEGRIEASAQPSELEEQWPGERA